jgi:hypothetical protein
MSVTDPGGPVPDLKDSVNGLVCPSLPRQGYHLVFQLGHIAHAMLSAPF